MAIWSWGAKPAWSFVIDTDGYGGGNTREVCGYLTGLTDEHGDRQAGPYIDMFFHDADPRTADFEDLVEERLCDPGDDGYHRAPADLAPTPGYANDGHGGHRKLKAGEVGEHPAFQSVAIFLSRQPTVQELNCLIERARRKACAYRLYRVEGRCSLDSSTKIAPYEGTASRTRIAARAPGAPVLYWGTR